jgi:histone demethylase JARID1
LGKEDPSPEDCKTADVATPPGNNTRRPRRGQSGCLPTVSPLTKKVKGRPYKHSELAETWLTQARAAGKSHSRSPVLEDLLTQADQFLWAGHEMDPVRAVVKRLNAAQKWVQDVAACSAAAQRHGNTSGGKAVKVNFSLVQRLVAVDPIPWVEPHLQILKALFEPAQRLEQQILGSLLSSSKLEVRELQTMQQEASHSAFELPGLQRLNDTLTSAKFWSERVRKVLSCTRVRTRNRKEEVTLEQLQSLHAEGLELPVIVEEMGLLSAAIGSVVEWQQQASKILASSSTEQEVEEALKAGEFMAVHVIEVDLLEDRLHKAKVWVQHARDALEFSQHRSNHAASKKMLGDLLQSERGLQMHGLHELGLLESELQKVCWLHSASQARRKQCTLSYLQDLIRQATGLQLADERLAIELNSTYRAAFAWELKAESLLSSRGSLTDFAEHASAGETILAKLPSLHRVKEAVSQSKSWLRRYQSFCKPLSMSIEEVKAEQLDLPTLQIMVEDSEKLLVVFDEGTSLRSTLAAAESWLFKANILKASVSVSQQSARQVVCPLNTRFEGESEHKKGSTCCREESESSTRLQDDLHKLTVLVNEGLALRLKIPEIAELQGLLSATTWSLKARHLIHTSPTVKVCIPMP